MNFKWYIGVLIVVASYFVVEQQSAELPNQEIVLTFSRSDISIDHQQAIAKIESRLVEIGAQQITISENANGTFKVNYFSKHALSEVKNHLFEVSIVSEFSTSLRFKNNIGKEPFQSDDLDYQIDIYEITDDVVSGMQHEGKCYFELKQDFNRGSQVDFSNLPKNCTDVPDNNIRVAERVNSELILTLNTFSYQIPEVRAGPIS